jgi:hypothetical protein
MTCRHWSMIFSRIIAIALYERAKKYTSFLRVYFLWMLQQGLHTQNTRHMSDQVHLPDSTFDHKRLHLAPPNGLQGGAFFAMMYYKDAPLYIQTPKCVSRQAVVQGKRPYIDLMFSSHDVAFLEWLEALEGDAIRMIYEKRNVWISADIEKSDIEAGFTSPVRPYKGGKYYLIRAHIQPSKHLAGAQSCSVFDENERPVSVEHIKAENQMYTVLEFQGIKFTSRSFQFEVALKQVLLVSNVPIFQSCVIRKPNHEGGQQHQASVSEPTSEEPVLKDPIHEDHVINKEEPVLKDPIHEDLVLNKEEPVVNEEPVHEHHVVKEEVIEDTVVPKEEVIEDTVVPKEEEMQEVNLDVLEELEHMHLKLKKPSEVYYNMYRIAKEKARELKKNAIAAYLEAKQIKTTYMLEDDDSESDESDIYSESCSDGNCDENES